MFFSRGRINALQVPRTVFDNLVSSLHNQHVGLAINNILNKCNPESTVACEKIDYDIRLFLGSLRISLRYPIIVLIASNPPGLRSVYTSLYLHFC